jgi:hypothetical protein
MSSSESGPLLSNVPRVGSYSSPDVPTPSIEIPISFQLLDISEDNKFLALIDDNFKLQVYELNKFGNQLTAKRQTMTDILCEIKCKNSVFVYISVASETGHVAVSFYRQIKWEIRLKIVPSLMNSQSLKSIERMTIKRNKNNSTVMKREKKLWTKVILPVESTKRIKATY